MNLTRPALALLATLVLGAQEPLPLRLPQPGAGGMALTDALQKRMSVRSLTGPGLTLNEAGQLLWAAQGENRPGRRTVPSAFAKYPLELYLVTAGSANLPAGFYHYQTKGHSLKKLADGGPNALLAKVEHMQPWIAAAPAVFVVAGDPARLDSSADARAVNLTYYEGGAAAQSLLLEEVALGLQGGTAAGLDMDALAKALKLPAGTRILTVLPVGREKGANS